MAGKVGEEKIREERWGKRRRVGGFLGAGGFLESILYNRVHGEHDRNPALTEYVRRTKLRCCDALATLGEVKYCKVTYINQTKIK